MTWRLYTSDNHDPVWAEAGVHVVARFVMEA